MALAAFSHAAALPLWSSFQVGQPLAQLLHWLQESWDILLPSSASSKGNGIKAKTDRGRGVVRGREMAQQPEFDP